MKSGAQGSCSPREAADKGTQQKEVEDLSELVQQHGIMTARQLCTREGGRLLPGLEGSLGGLSGSGGLSCLTEAAYGYAARIEVEDTVHTRWIVVSA